MELQIKDFNNAEKIFDGSATQQWIELSSILSKMPLHLKSSDQNGKQGKKVFDPIGTNEYIKKNILSINDSWQANASIPKPYQSFGKDVDFVNSSMLLEVQFSNYPFLLNNIIRSELFINNKLKFTDVPISSVILITKTNRIPAANSSLYFEQASQQITTLVNSKILTIPIRLVGLDLSNSPCDSIYTDYSTVRNSRTTVQQIFGSCTTSKPKNSSKKYEILFSC